MFTMVNHTLTLKQLLDSGIDIGLKGYPIWDESYREKLNKKIINHYYLREIGQETPGLFIHYLNMKMNEIMPYYVELYRTTQFDYEPLNSADYTIEYTKSIEDRQTGKTKGSGTSSNDSSVNSSSESSSNSNSSNTSNSENTSNTNGKNARVDTPQSQLDVNDIDNLDYATELNLAKQNGNESINSSSNTTNEDTQSGTSIQSSTSNSSNEVESESENTGNSVEVFKQHLVGDYGVKSSQALVQEERDLIINIDNMIIAELNSCFMMIW